VRALDLFCGAGGASMGLHRAGFDVTGIDIRPQPRYPFRFVRADALTPPVRLQDFDFIWASPPCQAHSMGAVWRGTAGNHPMLIEPTRQMLKAFGVPWAMENVARAPMRADLTLRGELFGLKVCRERIFEISGFWLMQPPLPFRGSIKRGDFVTVAGHGGDGSNSLKVWRRAIGIDWMSKEETAEAVPPAYSEYIGTAFLGQMQAIGIEREAEYVADIHRRIAHVKGPLFA
jgi:DNA (cytosine-5)-methyltransferase 1